MKKNDTRRVQKKKVKPKSQGAGVKSDKSDTTKKAKEPGEKLVTYAIKKPQMASSQCIKCGDPNHIKKDCTNVWKATKEDKKKTEKGKKKAAKVSAITGTVEIVSELISYSRIISEDELDFEVVRWILNRNTSCPVRRIRQSRRIGFQFVLLGKSSMIRNGRRNMRGKLWI